MAVQNKNLSSSIIILTHLPDNYRTQPLDFIPLGQILFVIQENSYYFNTRRGLIKYVYPKNGSTGGTGLLGNTGHTGGTGSPRVGYTGETGGTGFQGVPIDIYHKYYISPNTRVKDYTYYKKYYDTETYPCMTTPPLNGLTTPFDPNAPESDTWFPDHGDNTLVWPPFTIRQDHLTNVTTIYHSLGTEDIVIDLRDQNYTKINLHSEWIVEVSDNYIRINSVALKYFRLSDTKQSINLVYVRIQTISDYVNEKYNINIDKNACDYIKIGEPTAPIKIPAIHVIDNTIIPDYKKINNLTIKKFIDINGNDITYTLSSISSTETSTSLTQSYNNTLPENNSGYIIYSKTYYQHIPIYPTKKTIDNTTLSDIITIDENYKIPENIKRELPDIPLEPYIKIKSNIKIKFLYNRQFKPYFSHALNFDPFIKNYFDPENISIRVFIRPRFPFVGDVCYDIFNNDNWPLSTSLLEIQPMDYNAYPHNNKYVFGAYCYYQFKDDHMYDYQEKIYDHYHTPIFSRIDESLPKYQKYLVNYRSLGTLKWVGVTSPSLIDEKYLIDSRDYIFFDYAIVDDSSIELIFYTNSRVLPKTVYTTGYVELTYDTSTLPKFKARFKTDDEKELLTKCDLYNYDHNLVPEFDEEGNPLEYHDIEWMEPEFDLEKYAVKWYLEHGYIENKTINLDGSGFKDDPNPEKPDFKKIAEELDEKVPTFRYTIPYFLNLNNPTYDEDHSVYPVMDDNYWLSDDLLKDCSLATEDNLKNMFTWDCKLETYCYGFDDSSNMEYIKYVHIEDYESCLAHPDQPFNALRNIHSDLTDQVNYIIEQSDKKHNEYHFQLTEKDYGTSKKYFRVKHPLNLKPTDRFFVGAYYYDRKNYKWEYIFPDVVEWLDNDTLQIAFHEYSKTSACHYYVRNVVKSELDDYTFPSWYRPTVFLASFDLEYIKEYAPIHKLPDEMQTNVFGNKNYNPSMYPANRPDMPLNRYTGQRNVPHGKAYLGMHFFKLFGNTDDNILINLFDLYPYPKYYEHLPICATLCNMPAYYREFDFFSAVLNTTYPLLDNRDPQELSRSFTVCENDTFSLCKYYVEHYNPDRTRCAVEVYHYESDATGQGSYLREWDNTRKRQYFYDREWISRKSNRLLRTVDINDRYDIQYQVTLRSLFTDIYGIRDKSRRDYTSSLTYDYPNVNDFISPVFGVLLGTFPIDRKVSNAKRCLFLQYRPQTYNNGNLYPTNYEKTIEHPNIEYEWIGHTVITDTEWANSIPGFDIEDYESKYTFFDINTVDWKRYKANWAYYYQRSYNYYILHGYWEWRKDYNGVKGWFEHWIPYPYDADTEPVWELAQRGFAYDIANLSDDSDYATDVSDIRYNRIYQCSHSILSKQLDVQPTLPIYEYQKERKITDRVEAPFQLLVVDIYDNEHSRFDIVDPLSPPTNLDYIDDYWDYKTQSITDLKSAPNPNRPIDCPGVSRTDLGIVEEDGELYRVQYVYYRNRKIGYRKFGFYKHVPYLHEDGIHILNFADLDKYNPQRFRFDGILPTASIGIMADKLEELNTKYNEFMQLYISEYETTNPNHPHKGYTDESKFAFLNTRFNILFKNNRNIDVKITLGDDNVVNNPDDPDTPIKFEGFFNILLDDTYSDLFNYATSTALNNATDLAFDYACVVDSDPNSIRYDYTYSKYGWFAAKSIYSNPNDHDLLPTDLDFKVRHGIIDHYNNTNCCYNQNCRTSYWCCSHRIDLVAEPSFFIAEPLDDANRYTVVTSYNQVGIYKDFELIKTIPAETIYCTFEEALANRQFKYDGNKVYIFQYNSKYPDLTDLLIKHYHFELPKDAKLDTRFVNIDPNDKYSNYKLLYEYFKRFYFGCLTPRPYVEKIEEFKQLELTNVEDLQNLHNYIYNDKLYSCVTDEELNLYGVRDDPECVKFGNKHCWTAYARDLPFPLDVTIRNVDRTQEYILKEFTTKFSNRLVYQYNNPSRYLINLQHNLNMFVNSQTYNVKLYDFLGRLIDSDTYHVIFRNNTLDVVPREKVVTTYQEDSGLISKDGSTLNYNRYTINEYNLDFTPDYNDPYLLSSYSIDYTGAYVPVVVTDDCIRQIIDVIACNDPYNATRTHIEQYPNEYLEFNIDLYNGIRDQVLGPHKDDPTFDRNKALEVLYVPKYPDKAFFGYLILERRLPLVLSTTGGTGGIGSAEGLHYSSWYGGMGSTGGTGGTGETGGSGEVGATGPTGGIGQSGGIGGTGGSGGEGRLSTTSTGFTGGTGGSGGTGNTGGFNLKALLETHTDLESYYDLYRTDCTGGSGGIGGTGNTGLTGGIGGTGPPSPVYEPGPTGGTGYIGSIGITGPTGAVGGKGATYSESLNRHILSKEHSSSHINRLLLKYSNNLIIFKLDKTSYTWKCSDQRLDLEYRSTQLPLSARMYLKEITSEGKYYELDNSAYRTFDVEKKYSGSNVIIQTLDSFLQRNYDPFNTIDPKYIKTDYNLNEVRIKFDQILGKDHTLDAFYIDTIHTASGLYNPLGNNKPDDLYKEYNYAYTYDIDKEQNEFVIKPLDHDTHMLKLLPLDPSGTTDNKPITIVHHDAELNVNFTFTFDSYEAYSHGYLNLGISLIWH